MTALELAGWPLALGLSALGLVAATELRRRAELVARACHEVRGPLGAARLALAAMERRGEAHPARVAGLDLELRRAGLALDDLAAARRGARSAPRVAEPVELAALLEEQRFVWSAMARAFGGELVVEDASGAWVEGDRLRLAQALGNLVANAVEHGRGRIALTARADGATVRVEVADEGGGLPAPLAELTRRARGGRGARGRGLAIAAEVARAHGGRLETAPASRGARLVLELPALAARAARGAR